MVMPPRLMEHVAQELLNYCNDHAHVSVARKGHVRE